MMTDKRPIMNMQPITVEGRKVYAWTGDPWFQERAFKQRPYTSAERVNDAVRKAMERGELKFKTPPPFWGLF